MYISHNLILNKLTYLNPIVLIVLIRFLVEFIHRTNLNYKYHLNNNKKKIVKKFIVYALCQNFYPLDHLTL